MFDIYYLTVDLIVVVALAILGLTVFLKNKHVELNKVFAYFVVSVAIWIIANYISNDTRYAPTVALGANFVVFAFSYAACVFLLWFAILISEDSKARRMFKRFALPIGIIGALGATPLVVSDVSLQGNVYAVHFGPLLPVYAVSLLACLISVFWVTRKNMRHSTGTKRARLRVLYVSFCWSLPVLVLADFILPTVTGWFALTNIAIFPMLILVYGLYYSVFKHKLFDLKPVVVRTTAYVITLSILGGAFVLASNLLRSAINADNNNVVANIFNLLLIATILAISGPTKRFFDKVTDKIFYQDSYDAQELYAELNKMLVSSLDVKYLMMQSISIIQTALKPDYALIGLRDGEIRQRIFSSKKKEFEQGEITKIRSLTAKVHHKVIIADYLEGSKHSELKELLRKNDIAVLVRLAQNVRSNEEGFGYLALGTKKSGNQYTSQDVRVLDTVANELIIAIQNALHYEEIQQFNLVLQARVDDATRKLRRTNEKLKTLDETKDDFISMASHQLRTPLTSIKGYLSMVLEGDAGKINETQAKMLGQAFVSSQRMVYLIADLLNVSRLKTGKFIIEAAPTNLAKMVNEEMDQLVETAAGKQIELTYKQPKDFPDVMLDETKTRQVIMNFMDNAIYYTPSGGHIQVQVVDAPTSVELRVVDDGIGVPKAEQHHLFTKFYRAGNARKARPDGTGLGLFMAKKVVLAQGGSIIFESREGKGSTFGFLIPKHSSHSVAKLPVVPEKTATK